jgi:radical SAM protein with 4Fe4S-binding SPASM domain
MYELESIYENLNSMGVNRWSLLRLVPQGRCSKAKFLVPDHAEFLEMIDIIGNIIRKKIKNPKKYKTWIRVGDPLNFFLLIEKFKDIYPMTTCSAAKNRMLIRTNGEAQFCAALKHSPDYDYGNIYKNDIVNLWCFSEMAQKLREFHNTKYRKMTNCGACKYIHVCRGGCLSQRIAKHGDIMKGPDPLCPILKYGETVYLKNEHVG